MPSRSALRVVVAPNALKGSLSPFEAATAIARGIRAADARAEIVSLPIADGANLVITSEGLLDEQSLRNKGPCGVGRWAKRRNVPVIALAGGIADHVRPRDFPDFAGMFSICRRPMPLSEAMARAAELLESAAESVLRVFVAGRP